MESLYGLQGERSKLRGELRLLRSQLEQKDRDRHSRILAFQQQVGIQHLCLNSPPKYQSIFLAQIDELKSGIEEREEELCRLKTATVSPFECSHSKCKKKRIATVIYTVYVYTFGKIHLKIRILVV